MTSPAKTVRIGKDSSPDSHGTEGSRYASPSTAPTNYSPTDSRDTGDDPHSAAKLIHQLNFMNLGGSSSRQVKMAQLSDDPFIDVRTLSATAAEYQPGLRAQASEYRPASFRSPAPQYQPSHRTHGSNRTALAALKVGSTPDAASRIGGRLTLPIDLINASISAGELVSPRHQIQTGGAVLTPVREDQFRKDVFSPKSPLQIPAQVPVSVSPLSPHAKAQAIYGAFTSDPDITGNTAVTRYLALENLDAIDADERHVQSKLPAFRQTGALGSAISMKKTPGGGLVFRFDHLHDAKSAYTRALEELQHGFPESWTLTFVKAASFHGSDSQRQFEGQVNIKLYSGSMPEMRRQSLERITEIATSFAWSIGDVAAWRVQPAREDSPDRFLVRLEMASCEAADTLVRVYGDRNPLTKYPGFELEISPLYRSVPTSTNTSPMHRHDSVYECGLGTPGRYSNNVMPSPYSPLQFGATSKAQLNNRAQTQVDPARIRSGDDVRTTVMIRNIPNKLDAEEFRKILNQVVFGKYDFSYLRIDFQNLCNVGYAFVNFTQAEHIILLYDHIVHKPWNIFNSDKIAEMCYATIQGLDCCVDKFRNSSVMLEWQPHRPKLWFTENDGQELCGLEKPFPEPTNFQKLQRSKDNAAEIGLYPPRGITGYRHENRHHVSMFDRGHPRAIEEEQRQTPSRVLTTPPQFGYMSSTVHPSPGRGLFQGHGIPPPGLPSPLSPSGYGMTAAMSPEFMPAGYRYHVPNYRPANYGQHVGNYSPASPMGLRIEY